MGIGLRNNVYAPRKIKIGDEKVIRVNIIIIFLTKQQKKTQKISIYNPKKITQQFSCGDRHSGYITEYGKLFMMGSNESGQCGISGFVEFVFYIKKILLKNNWIEKKKKLINLIKLAPSIVNFNQFFEG